MLLFLPSENRLPVSDFKFHEQKLVFPVTHFKLPREEVIEIRLLVEKGPI
jgi:hypothetical protein